MTYKKQWILLLSLLFSTTTGIANTEESSALKLELYNLSLEELLQIQVITSVSKREQGIDSASAAIFIITEEDIRRSGAINVPELLKMVPGLEIARKNAFSWDVTARGFSGHQNGKLLVLIDGRTVYSPHFYSTSWHVHGDPFLEDIERIEVIRGPGGTLWGANAVNGVINVITKQAKNTQGNFVAISAGSEQKASVATRYGGTLGEGGYFRIYAKGIERDNSVLKGGTEETDDWRTARTGFRIDQQVNNHDFTLQGDLIVSRLTERFPDPTYDRNGNLLFRWNRMTEEQENMTLQIYYDRSARSLMPFGFLFDTFDIDFQHNLTLARQKIVWGIGYRQILTEFEDRNLAAFRVNYIPTHRNDTLLSAFIEDEIALIPEKLILKVGSKFEHNEFSGFEVQPNLRLLWRPQAHQVVWTALSRAVRTPSAQDHTVVFDAAEIPPSPPDRPFRTVVRAFGNEEFTSEEVIAYELGFRTQATKQFSYDIATFFNKYDDLYLIGMKTPYLHPDGYAVAPIQVVNGLKGTVFGLELATNWQATEKWQLQAAYTYLNMDISVKEGHTPSIPEDAEGQSGKSPHHQLSLRSAFDLSNRLKFDLWLRYVDELPSLKQESYTDLSARLAWTPFEGLELSLVGQGLLDKQRSEFGGGAEIGEPTSSEIERNIYARIEWKF